MNGEVENGLQRASNTQPALLESAPISGPKSKDVSKDVRDGTSPLEGPRTFEEMGLLPEIKRALGELGFVEPMPVQRAVFGPMMERRDILVQSRTGSGKTAAFGIPLAQALVDNKSKQVQALILAPTRELALQSAEECGKIAVHRGLTVAPIYGGAPMGRQIELLKAGAQVVSGTPGRVLDHLKRGTLKLDALSLLVLDEADEMLSMGFFEELTEIIRRCPADRQTVLFSATIPEDIERIATRYMRSPEKIQLTMGREVSVQEIRHIYYMVSGMGRARDLLRVLEVERPDSAIIFCNTREDTALVAEFLRRSELDAEAISSDLTQRDRERVMTRMKEKKLKYLVATDIAARGIDISDLSHVINYSFPESAEVYVHRTGRTGRAGKSGVAISLISPRELGNFYMLKLTYKIRPEERVLPSDEEAKTVKEAARIDELRGLLGERDPGLDLRALARRLWSSEEGERLVGILIEERLRRGAPKVAATPVPPPPETLAGAVSTTAHAAPSVQAPQTLPPSRARVAPRAAAEDDVAEERDERTSAIEAAVAEEGAPRERHRRRRRRERSGPALKPGVRLTEVREPKQTLSGTIDTSDGREFWEVWADSKSDEVAALEVGTPTRREQEERPRPRPSEAAPTPTGQARLYLNLGRRDGAEEEDLRRILGEKGLSAENIDLRSSHTYLNVPETTAEQFCATLSGEKYGDRELRCERAKR